MPVINANPIVRQEQASPQVQRLDEQLMPPGKYEVTPETKFKIEFWIKLVDERYIICPKSKDATKEEVVFRMWSYTEMVEMKKKCNSYDQIKRMYWLDNDLLNRVKIQKLLLSWTLDKSNPRLKLVHVNGVLCDEGWGAFTKVQPNISKYILDRMNDVLEFNG